MAYLHNIVEPSLRALAALADERDVVVRWKDGQEALVHYDTHLEGDAEAGWVETFMVRVLKLHHEGPRSLAVGEYADIRADDPPAQVWSPDNSRVWHEGDAPFPDVSP